MPTLQIGSKGLMSKLSLSPTKLIEYKMPSGIFPPCQGWGARVPVKICRTRLAVDSVKPWLSKGTEKGYLVQALFKIQIPILGTLFNIFHLLGLGID